MDHRVFKYSVPVDDEWHKVDMPPSSQVLMVGCAEPWNTVQFWVEVQVVDLVVPRTFQVFGTGHPIPNDALYQGSVIAAGGALVWHLYEAWREQEIEES